MVSDTQNRSIFNPQSEDRPVSPEKMNEYIRTGGPGIIFIVAALLIVVIALIVWGFAGTLPVTESVTGLVDPNSGYHVICFVDASRFSPGNLSGKQVSIRMADGTGVSGTVESVSEVPLSWEQASALIDNDWLTLNMVNVSYSFLVSIEPERDLSAYGHQLVDASIITDEVKPITFLMR